MIHQNEVVMLTMGCCVAVFALLRWTHLRRAPKWGQLFSAYCCLLCAWAATVIEGFVWPNMWNVVEHGMQMLAYILLSAWVWSVFLRGETGRADH